MPVLRLLEGVANSRVEANTITCSAAISACEKAGEWARALQLLDGMAKSRVEADTITYNAAISACEQVCDWVRALQLLGGMATTRWRQLGGELCGDGGREGEREGSSL